MDHLLHEGLRLRALTEQTRIDFIRTDLDLCLTFAKVAETAIDMGNSEHAERSMSNAEKGYTDMLRFFSQATDISAGDRRELQSKFKRLRERLDGLKRFRPR